MIEPVLIGIYAQTLGAVYGIGLGVKVGSIEEGKKADLIVLDQNLFEIDPHEIHDTASNSR